MALAEWIRASPAPEVALALAATAARERPWLLAQVRTLILDLGGRIVILRDV